MDGKALPNILDRCSMSFFQPPSLNTLEPYQLEFLESIFKQVWSQIVPRHYPLSPTCGNTYKQKLVRGSVPSSREE